MRHLLILGLILGVSNLIAFGQNSTERSGCPIFSVAGPSSSSEIGKTIPFKLETTEKLGSNIKINWTVSYGKILSGQGTESIMVENLLAEGKEITAVVELQGLPENCQKTAAASQIFCAAPIVASKLDEFNKTTRKIISEKVKNFSDALKKDPTTMAVISRYFTNKTNKLNAYLNLQLILNYLKSYGINEERIIFQTAFSENETTEFWVVSPGAQVPQTIDAKYESFNVAQLKHKINESSKKK